MFRVWQSLLTVRFRVRILTPRACLVGLQLFSTVASRQPIGHSSYRGHRSELVVGWLFIGLGALPLTQFCGAEQHGGSALATNISLSSATHVVVQHQQQPACAEAAQQQKEVVTCYWILACAQTKKVLPCTHPVRVLACLPPVPTSASQQPQIQSCVHSQASSKAVSRHAVP